MRIGFEQAKYRRFESMGDSEIIELVRKSNSEAFEYIYHKYFDYLFLRAYKFKYDPNLQYAPREIVHETIIAFYEIIRTNKDFKLKTDIRNYILGLFKKVLQKRFKEDSKFNLLGGMEAFEKLERYGSIVDNSQISDLPSELLMRESSDSLEYFAKIKEEGATPLLEAKVIFIGSGEVGKTSLINMMLDGQYNRNEGKTDGISIRDWEIKRKSEKIDLHIWDFGGQEIMHATHKFFMTKRSLYVLVINPRMEDRHGDTELDYWLKLISSYGANSPVIVVINKCETHKADFGTGEIMDKYPQIVDFVETSCAQNIGIDKLKGLINKGVCSLPHLDDKIPISFFKIKQLLEQKNQAYIDYLQYKELCKFIDKSVSEKDMKILVNLLNDLGIMLSITENRRLENTHVLNPEWITNGVYKIINSEKLVRDRGTIKEKELNDVLDVNIYPTLKECGFIMDMMTHFELCYQLPENNETYFIPSVFPKDRPKKLNWKADLKKFLRFQFHYEILPISVISRFIVKVHDLIHKSFYWRSGLVIKHRTEKNIALIRADLADKKIYIEVTGNGNLRATLSYIRTEFEKIHRSISRLGT